MHVQNGHSGRHTQVSLQKQSAKHGAHQTAGHMRQLQTHEHHASGRLFQGHQQAWQIPNRAEHQREGPVRVEQRQVHVHRRGYYATRRSRDVHRAK